MSDQSKLGLGQIIKTPQERDAIHVAVAPVICGDSTLSPGEHVGILPSGRASIAGNHIGVVDPFLSVVVKEGERFWLFLYPGSITSLRHEWSHPSFTNTGTPVSSESERWLRNFANAVDADYEEMMAVAASHCGDREWGDYLCEGGKWEGQCTPDEFWAHYENVTGMKPNNKYGLPGIFSCSC